jgi:TolB-like protein
MGEEGVIRLLLVTAGGAAPPRLLADPAAIGDPAALPAGSVIGLVAGGAAEAAARAAALAGAAAHGGGDPLVTAGARELLLGRPGIGFAYAGAVPDPDGSGDTELWRIVPARFAGLLDPVRRGRDPGDFMLAVLPFRAAGGDAPLQERAWGLSDDITAALTRFRSLKVLGRGAAWAWRTSALTAVEIGGRLGTALVLEGLLRPSGHDLRLDVSLVEVRSGRAVWAERFIRPPPGFFGVAETVTDRVVAAAARAAGEAELSARPPPRSPSDGRAHDLVLRGRGLLARLDASAHAEAAALADAAIDLDPGHAPALALRARCHGLAWRLGWAPDPPAALAACLSAALAATAADPHDAVAWGELGLARLYRREHAAAESAYRTAIGLNPGDPDLLAEAAHALSHLGHDEEAFGLIERAMLLNPWYPDLYLRFLGRIEFGRARYGDAIRAIRRMQDPSEGLLVLAASYAMNGQRSKAAAAARAIRATFPDFTVDLWAGAEPTADPAAVARFAEGLRRAGLP